MRQPRDWIQISVTALPGLAAVIALIFTWVAVNATNNQLQISEQGQITDRYNAAITNLGSSSIDVRLGGIYALQRIMQDSPRDQPTVVAVLCAFVRDHSNAATAKSAHASASAPVFPGSRQVPTDIQAVLTVVGTRDIAHDGSTTVVDFTYVDFSDMNLSYAHLTGANLTGAALAHAVFFEADLSHAHLNAADLTGADLFAAHLTGADLFAAHLTGADLTGADLTGADLTGANLTGADLTGTKGIPTSPDFSPGPGG